jgi:ATP-binding cassette, subfamily B, bacterial
MAMIRFFRDEPSSVDRSGLTGDPDIPDPPRKEVKLFGLGGFFTERFRLLGQVFYGRVRRLAVQRSLVSGGWGILGPLVGSLTYLYIALQAVAGRLTLGDLTLYAQATNSVQNGIQQVFSSFSTLYENALYAELFTLQASAYVD